MPKKIDPAEIEAIESVLLRHPEGVSLDELLEALDGSIGRRTLARRLESLIVTGRAHRQGLARATRYLYGRAASTPTAVAAGPFETPDGVVEIGLSGVAGDILEYVSRPAAARRPCGYERRLLDDYEPNKSKYLPDAVRVRLHEIGKPIVAERAGGTFARDILNRFLVDLAWASSRLEGNTYSRLDTERLIQFGQEAQGKDAKETQMILNHKAAIELLVGDNLDDIGLNRFTLLNLHALLSENLMSDPEASGRLRNRPVDISGSVYTPSAIPALIDECFSLVLDKATMIRDPLEQAFFVMVHVPYLQPFEDVNKRVSRLAANIPLIRADLCPLSFVDVPERAYIAGTLSVYELTRMELLRDVFVWAYERSCQRYVVIRDSVAEPDLFRMKYRNALIEVIGGVVREGKQPTAEEIRAAAESLVESRDLSRFVDLVTQEFARLNEGNIARYRIRLADYRSWVRAISLDRQ